MNKYALALRSQLSIYYGILLALDQTQVSTRGAGLTPDVCLDRSQNHFKLTVQHIFQCMLRCFSWDAVYAHEGEGAREYQEAQRARKAKEGITRGGGARTRMTKHRRRKQAALATGLRMCCMEGRASLMIAKTRKRCWHTLEGMRMSFSGSSSYWNHSLLRKLTPWSTWTSRGISRLLYVAPSMPAPK